MYTGDFPSRCVDWCSFVNSEIGLFAMTIDPGEHLKGLKLMNATSIRKRSICCFPSYRTLQG